MERDRERVDVGREGYAAAHGDVGCVFLCVREPDGRESASLVLGVGQAERLGRALLQQAEVARRKDTVRRAERAKAQATA